VEVAERFADGQATPYELGVATNAAIQVNDKERDQIGLAPYWATSRRPAKTVANTSSRIVEVEAMAAARAVQSTGREQAAAYNVARDKAAREQADLLREVFGNPFRPAAADPAWLSWQGGTVRALAEAAYEDQAFEILPVLADALEEAGCADAEVLAHLRSTGKHVRGCWALDLLLARD
jgi:hypothetical protein